MATRITTYDPAQIQVTVGGAILTGFEPGTFVNLTRAVNNFDYSVGPDGKEGIRAKRNDRSGMFTFTLRQASVGNLILSNLANRDEVDGDGVVPVQITDLNNPDTQYISGAAWIENHSVSCLPSSDTCGTTHPTQVTSNFLMLFVSVAQERLAAPAQHFYWTPKKASTCLLKLC